MTDCGCEKARAELEEYLHNELRSDDAADIREHVANCADCQAELRVGVAITEVVQRACKEIAPERPRRCACRCTPSSASTSRPTPPRPDPPTSCRFNRSFDAVGLCARVASQCDRHS
jgi:anti-sigma factor (TIGR02949 family)